VNDELLVQESHGIQNVDEDLYAFGYWGIFLLEVVAQVAFLAEVHIQRQSFGLWDWLGELSTAPFRIGYFHLLPVQQLQHVVAIDYLHHGPLIVRILDIVLVEDDAFPHVFGPLSPACTNHLQDCKGIAADRKQSWQLG
jgi:hypothetical protein